jgi:aminoglycoside 6'-N-acetyltransferase
LVPTRSPTCDDVRVLLRDADITVRSMRDDPGDYARIVRWRAEPHVHEWWDPDEPAPSYEEVVEQYRPRTQVDDDTTSCIIERDGRAIGYLQFYRWASTPEEARAMDVMVDEATYGLDIFIGEVDDIGRGIGTRVVDLLCGYLEDECGASGIALTTELTNHRAQRAYEKAGFRKTKEVLDVDTRDGRRVRSWLMQRRRSAAPR